MAAVATATTMATEATAGVVDSAKVPMRAPMTIVRAAAMAGTEPSLFLKNRTFDTSINAIAMVTVMGKSVIFTTFLNLFGRILPNSAFLILNLYIFVKNILDLKKIICYKALMSKKENEKKETADQQIEEDIEIVADADGDKSSFGKTPQDVVKDLKEKLKQCEKERQEYLDGWQRAKADFANARKDEEKAREEFKKFANENLLLHILSVMDSFEMAFSNKEAWEKATQEWRTGVEYIYSQLKKILEGHGLHQLHSIGEHFNPMVHESVGLIPTDDASKDGVIVEVVSSGYSLHGKVVRAPRVRVGEVAQENPKS